jgi:molybdopterin/thiamine biosynthesis adenylyltransferase
MPGPPKSIDYSRLEQTPFTRRQVASLTLAVIGCGALGSEAARLLGLLGIGTVLLIDHDRVEPTNLTHSYYLRSPNVIGCLKADVLAESLAPVFPDTRWLPVSLEIADTGFALLKTCDLLLSCTDNTLARVETAYAAYRLRLPMMDAGLKGRAVWSGRVAWFPANPVDALSSNSAACYLCQLSAARRAELLSLSLAASQSCAQPLDDTGTLASTPTMASIVAALQVDLGLRLYLLPEPQLEACAWELDLALPQTSWTPFTIPRSVDCPFHDVEPQPTPLPMNRPLRETLGQHSLQLDWPICLHARCAVCQHLWTPLVRVATLRRRTTCPNCNSTQLHSIETLTTLAPTDAAALRTPTQLHLPENHLFTLKPI